MPTSKHALCIWMIVAKFPSWFNSVLGERYNEWKGEFYRLYNLESIEDFEVGWREMVNSFGLHTNRHVINLYGLRTFWALPFLRSHFFAGMTTIGQSKSINAFIQRFLSAQTRLAHFVEQVCCYHCYCFLLFLYFSFSISCLVILRVKTIFSPLKFCIFSLLHMVCLTERYIVYEFIRTKVHEDISIRRLINLCIILYVGSFDIYFVKAQMDRQMFEKL